METLSLRRQNNPLTSPKGLSNLLQLQLPFRCVVQACKGKEDPCTKADLWGQYIPAAGSAQQQSGISAAAESIHQLESKIENAVLAKLPQCVAMDQDDVTDRVQDLESRFNQLTQRQQQLEVVVNARACRVHSKLLTWVKCSRSSHKVSSLQDTWSNRFRMLTCLNYRWHRFVAFFPKGHVTLIKNDYQLFADSGFFVGLGVIDHFCVHNPEVVRPTSIDCPFGSQGGVGIIAAGSQLLFALLGFWGTLISGRVGMSCGVLSGISSHPECWFGFQFVLVTTFLLSDKVSNEGSNNKAVIALVQPHVLDRWCAGLVVLAVALFTLWFPLLLRTSFGS